MKRKCLLILFYILLTKCYCQQWAWAKIIDSTLTNPEQNSVAADGQGNFFITTNYSDNLGNPIGIGIIKFDSVGNQIWNNHYSANAVIQGLSFSNNNIYVTGYFANSFIIENDTVISNGGFDGFLFSLDASGNYNWAKGFGGSSNDFGYGICCDANFNVFITGGFSDTLHIDSFPYPCFGSVNTFLIKLNSNGNIAYVKTFNGNYSYGNKLVSDSMGNVYLLGEYLDIYCDTNYFHSDYYRNDFLCKIDTLGNVIWAKIISEDTENLIDISVNSNSHIVACGYYGWTSGGHSITRSFDYYGQQVWSKTIKPACYGDDMSLKAVTSDNNISIAVGNTEIHYCPNWTTIRHLLIAQYDSLGGVIFIDTLKVTANSFGHEISFTEITTDSNGDFIICGTIIGAMKIGSDTLIASNKKLFIAKLLRGSSIVNVYEKTIKSTLNVFPNPSKSVFTIEYFNTANDLIVNISNQYGQKIIEKKYSASNEFRELFDLSAQAKGLYFIGIPPANCV